MLSDDSLSAFAHIPEKVFQMELSYLIVSKHLKCFGLQSSVHKISHKSFRGRGCGMYYNSGMIHSLKYSRWRPNHYH